jgi:signal transduction histidine kinase
LPPSVDRLPALRSILRALKDPHTYNLRRNPFTLLGFLWGLPLSAFSIFVDLWVIGHPERLQQFWREPVHLLFLLHPFLFGIVFGAVGTVHAGQDLKIAELLEQQRRHLEELASANADLKYADELKNQFVANVTHELKTPLVAIKGYNEAIFEGRFGPLTPKQRDGLKIAVRNIVRLQDLIQRILEFERIESSGYRPRPSDFDLVALVRLVLSNFQPQVDEKHLTVELSVPERLDVRADYEGIRRVLLNLLSNAVKFSDNGGAFGVDARMLDEPPEAEVGVWDRGPGIPQEAQRFLFSRFWQADGSSRRRHGGTGPGLAIVKGILDAHQASVRVISAPGSGTALKFRLPRARAAATVEESSHALGKAAHRGR